MLWLALHFPLLPLEAQLRAEREHLDSDQPLGIEQGKRLLILNPAAAQAGVEPGMSTNAALALAADLRTLPRREDLEHLALTGLAGWALQFSSIVSLEEPDGLLLEVGGSLKLFSGLDPLLARVELGLIQLGYSLQSAIAPTPTAAWLAAHCGLRLRVTNQEQLTQTMTRALGRLPLNCLYPQLFKKADKALETLQGMGLKRFADLLELPRDGVSQRFGPTLLNLLDRAQGRKPDPRLPFCVPDTFHGHIDLPIEVQGGQTLDTALERMVLELTGFLRGQDAATSKLNFDFHHLPQSDQAELPLRTPLALALLNPSRDPRHILDLLHTRLDQLRFPAPVIAVSLDCEQLQRFDTQPEDLFDTQSQQQQDLPQLLERLQARLGRDAIQGLSSQTDPRPEKAWRAFRLDDAPKPSDPAPTKLSWRRRPLWLLIPPRSIQIDPRQVHTFTGPERIESGWWDGEDQSRDYFRIRTHQGRQLWVYRDLREPGVWYLHGVFA